MQKGTLHRLGRLPFIIGAIFVAGAATAGVVWSLRSPRVSQPIGFNHRIHVQELEMACDECHLYAVNGVRATIPNIAVCGDCHDEPLTESIHEARLMEYVNSDTPLPWQKVYWVPDHVYFSHRRHTGIAGIECQACHGPIEEQEEPLTRPLVRLTMEHCMACHEQTGTSNDCILCHR